MKPVELKKNLFAICMSVVLLSLFVLQLTTSLIGKQSVEQVIAKNETVIETIYANKMSHVTLSSDTFNFSLPKGMQLYAHTDSNLKLRSRDIFYTAHILTSKIKMTPYAKETFPEGTTVQLPSFRGEESFARYFQLNNNTVKVSIYNEHSAVTFVSSNAQLETNFLMGIELLRNIEVVDFKDVPIFIGSTDDRNNQTVLDGKTIANDEEESDELEVSVR